MMLKIMEGNGTLDDYVEMYWLADTIKSTADCAIGYEAAYMPFFSNIATEALIENYNGEQALVSMVDGIRQPLASIYTKKGD